MTRAAVLGSPIAHSKSPALHRAAYAAAGLDWAYDAIEVGPAGLAALIGSLGPEWAGLSLTMPLKETVVGLLDTVDPLVRLTGAANTVVLPGAPTSTGGRAGFNTDVEGIVEALREAGVRAPATGAVLGAGATAKSAVAALGELGVATATVHARRQQAAVEVIAVAEAVGIAAQWRPFEDVAAAATAGVVVSTVPAGAADRLAPVLAGASGVLLDVVYDPWPTPLAAAWGGPVVPGISMLLWQAVAQVRLMTGIARPDVAAMRRAVGLGG